MLTNGKSMNLFETILISIGLAMDCFAVSLCAATINVQKNFRYRFRISFHFGLFHVCFALMREKADSVLHRHQHRCTRCWTQPGPGRGRDCFNQSAHWGDFDSVFTPRLIFRQKTGRSDWKTNGNFWRPGPCPDRNSNSHRAPRLPFFNDCNFSPFLIFSENHRQYHIFAFSTCLLGRIFAIQCPSMILCTDFQGLSSMPVFIILCYILR